MNSNLFTKANAVLQGAGIALCVAAAFVAILGFSGAEQVPPSYSSGGMAASRALPLAIPAAMLALNIAMSLAMLFVPPRFWNTPVKPKPGRELWVLCDMFLFLSIMEMLFGVFALALTLSTLRGHENLFFPIALFAVVAMLVAFAATFAAMLRHNK